MMAPKLRFSRCLKEKAPDAVACTARVLTPTSRSSAASAHRLNTRSNDGEGEEFFFFTFDGLSSVWLLFYQRFDAAVLLLNFSWQLTRNVLLATILVYSYRRSLDEDGRSLWVGTSEVFVHSNSASSVVNFFPTRRPRHQFPLPANLHRHSRRPRFQQDKTRSLLDRRRHESIQTYSSYQLVSHLGTSTTLFPRHLDKNRAKHRRTVFSKPREQAAINELTKKTPRTHATTTTSMAGPWQMRRN